MKIPAKLASAVAIALALPAAGLVQGQPGNEATPAAPAPAPPQKVQNDAVTKTIILPPAVEEAAERAGVPKPVAAPPRPAPASVRVAPRISIFDNIIRNNGLADPAQAVPEAMTGQMVRQLRPYFHVELRLLTKASEPSPTQRREIALQAGKATREVAAKVAKFQQDLNMGRLVNGALPDASKAIREAFAGAAKAKLSPEQFARYQTELDGRNRDHRRAVVLNLVASLDRLLLLSPDQREKLGASLLDNWDDRVYPPLEMVANFDTYFPQLPDADVSPSLNERQRKIWRAAPTTSFGRSSQINFRNNVMELEEDDEDVKAALAEEPAK